MKGKEICLCLLVIVFLTGVPGSGYSEGISGNQLVENMRKFEKLDKDSSDPLQVLMGAHYIGYVGGVTDVLRSFGLIRAEKATHGQLCAVVAKYLKANPEKWHAPAVYLVLMALQEAFPPESKKAQP